MTAAPAADAADQQWVSEDEAVLEVEAVEAVEVAEAEVEVVVVVDTRRHSRSISTRSSNNP